MRFELKPFDPGNNLDLSGLKNSLDKSKAFRGEPIVLERNANSDLVARLKPVTEEFFESVFDPFGPFWSTYSEAGFALRPVGAKYAISIAGQLYFLKNTENVFIVGSGRPKQFKIKGNLLYETKGIGVEDLLLFAAFPFDTLKQFSRTVEFSFLANEIIKEFEEFREKTLDYYKNHRRSSAISDPLETAKESLHFAVQSMVYSNFAFLSHILKLKLKRSGAIANCELDQMNYLMDRKDPDEIKRSFGFYSLSPYDISSPRFSEDISFVREYGVPKAPSDYSLKWRENAKFLAARYLAVERLAWMKLGKKLGIDDFIFYLKTSEFNTVDVTNKKEVDILFDLAARRKEEWERYHGLELPSKIIYNGGRFYTTQESMTGAKTLKVITAESVSSKRIVTGPAVVINSLKDYSKFTRGSIIVSKDLSPNLTILYGKIAGVISAGGGALAHAAIVARERNIPCFVSAGSVVDNIKDGQILKADGKTGQIKILDHYFGKETSFAVQENEDLPFETYEKVIENVLSQKRKFMEKEIFADIVPVSEENQDTSSIGTKASNLSKLSSSYDVPGGFCVTAGVFRKLMESAELGGMVQELQGKRPEDIEAIEKISKKIREAIIDYPLPPAFEDDLNRCFLTLAPDAIVVRSSSSLEDGRKISFAGQFDSFLNIRDPKGLRDALRSCWASFYNTRAIIYRLENKISDDEATMSVIVQKMIDAQYSGVVFTRDIEHYDALRIEAVKGAGEDLVSGSAKPNSYIVSRKNHAIVRSKEEFEFNPETLKEIAITALKIEETFGSPQDIEWSIDWGGKLWILQARPITAFSNNGIETGV